jgi:hypothetical protein
VLRRVFTAEHISEAGLIRSYLEQHDIPSQLRNEYTSSVIGELPFMTSSPEIWVDSSLAPKANELITQLNKQTTQGPEWSCLSCDEPNPGNFSSCWSCQEIQA